MFLIDASGSMNMPDKASATLFPIAKDVKIQVEFNPAKVGEYRLIGYETRRLGREDFNNDRVDAGVGHSVTAIYELTPVGNPAQRIDDLRYGARSAGSPRPGDGSAEYAYLKIRCKLPDADTSRLLEFFVDQRFLHPEPGQAPAEARFASAVAAFGQMLRGDPRMGDYSYEDVVALAEPARGKDRFGYRSEFLNLVRLAKTARAMGVR